MKTFKVGPVVIAAYDDQLRRFETFTATRAGYLTGFRLMQLSNWLQDCADHMDTYDNVEAPENREFQ